MCAQSDKNILESSWNREHPPGLQIFIGILLWCNFTDRLCDNVLQNKLKQINLLKKKSTKLIMKFLCYLQEKSGLENGTDPHGDDPLGGDDDHDKLMAIARAFEDKYVSTGDWCEINGDAYQILKGCIPPR